jgi:hypothetical protein
MGKASRRPRGSARATASTTATKAAPPYARRPFEGLTQETDWVALREILPAATMTVRLRTGAAEPAEGSDGAEGAGDAAQSSEVTIATVLPMAWPGLHRADGAILVATQSGGSSGDASRDLAAALLATRDLPAGTALVQVPAVSADTPRLQDLLDPAHPVEVTVHEGFDFWVGDSELDDDAQESLSRANESVVPTTPMASVPSAFHVVIGDRAFIRVVVGDDEDAATDALARLHAAGDDDLGEGTRLLGAFRACGLLVPVLEVPVDSAAADHEDALGEWGRRYAAAVASSDPLSADERRARNGLLSRQVTLR